MADTVSENKSQSHGRDAAKAERPGDGRFSSNREPAGESRRISSEQLLGSATQVVIEHAGQEYRLCKTRNGKLILVK